MKVYVEKDELRPFYRIHDDKHFSDFEIDLSEEELRSIDWFKGGYETAKSEYEAKLKEAVEVIGNLVEDIETPQRLGLSEINKDWVTLNKAREFLKSLE